MDTEPIFAPWWVILWRVFDVFVCGVMLFSCGLEIHRGDLDRALLFAIAAGVYALWAPRARTDLMRNL